MDKREAIQYLKDRMKDIPALAKLKYNNMEYPLWIQTIRGVIEKVFGKNSYEYQQLAEAYEISGSFSEVRQSSYKSILRKRAETIMSIIQTWEAIGFKTEMNRKAESPKAFIAHEGMTGVLTRLREFLEALGVEYSIAEIEASNGRDVEKQVQWTQGKADFAIILAAKGKAIDKTTGEPYMGLNVADELGRAREVFRNRIILLLQRGVKPHTNVSGIVYEPFSPQNLEKSFIKIIRELRNWGFIQVAKTQFS